MTENEIIKMLEVEKAYMDSHAGTSQSEALAYAIESVKEIQEYRAIGTIEEFNALKEKNEPKKPIIHGLGQRYCPVCKCGGADHFYCARCGQKLG